MARDLLGIIDLREGRSILWEGFLESRTAQSSPGLADVVAATLKGVRDHGWDYACECVRQYDAPEMTVDGMRVTEEELAGAEVSETELEAIRASIARVRHFHEAQLSSLTAGWQRSKSGYDWSIPTLPGSSGREGQRLLPARRAGIYVPGGMASYPSSVIMNAVPALVAGVAELVICTPPRADGTLSQAVLVAARELGINQMVKCGGAAAISLMAGQLACDVIAGPGNRYVAEAKRQLWGRVGLDGFAGPSEVTVVYDSTVPARAAALDLLTQIEHAPNNEGVLIVWEPEVAEQVIQMVHSLLEQATRREVMECSLLNHSAVVIAKDRNHALELANELAPEHLALLIDQPETAVTQVPNAGSVSLGPYSAQSLGDFINGPSHTLPTSGSARFSSPVNVMTFMRFQSVSQLTRSDAAAMAPWVRTFGEMENLPLHGMAADPRERD